MFGLVRRLEGCFDRLGLIRARHSKLVLEKFGLVPPLSQEHKANL